MSFAKEVEEQTFANLLKCYSSLSIQGKTQISMIGDVKLVRIDSLMFGVQAVCSMNC